MRDGLVRQVELSRSRKLRRLQTPKRENKSRSVTSIYFVEQSMVEESDEALTVLKTRASHHEPESRGYMINPDGIMLGSAIAPD